MAHVDNRLLSSIKSINVYVLARYFAMLQPAYFCTRHGLLKNMRTGVWPWLSPVVWISEDNIK